jgi:hypothetical protein
LKGIDFTTSNLLLAGGFLLDKMVEENRTKINPAVSL